MSATTDALDLVKFCWPDKPWQVEDEHGDPTFMFAIWHHDVRHSDKLDEAAWSGEDAADIAAAERVLVERGLGVEYRDAMVNLYHREVMNTDWRYDYDVWALVAPLDARLRAMARVARAQQSKARP